jgi:5-methylcytosine-specific restriction protein B
LFLPLGAVLSDDTIVGTEDLSELARAALQEECAVRCQNLSTGAQQYLKFREDELRNYEIGTEIALALGIPETGGVGEKKTLLSRQAIEAAMDAYDSYRTKGTHSNVFNALGEPRDYWVRSTRDRRNRVYSTKPLIGFILNKTELNDGWGQKSDAAARLYNAGFIIVDHEDNPIPPPDRYEHLMSGADRIRLCALNYFIEPARENDLTEVSIHAGDLATAIGLKDAFPNICQALGGERFQQLAKVPPPTHTAPNPSSSTTFTYKLVIQSEEEPVTEAPQLKATSATNLILYGPPGTGKTFHTAWEAVRLCRGNEVAAGLSGERNRERLMAEYRRLMDDGRIEFVTFHQSMSYEEFVEGLRPTMSRDAESEGSAAFTLEPVPGIFQRIARRAEASADDGKSHTAQHSDADEALIKEERKADQFSLDRTTESFDDHDLGERLDRTSQGPLYTVGQLPPVNEGTFRHVAQEVAKRLAKDHPNGFTLKQYRDSLVRAGHDSGVEPTGGWEAHNMPNWASHPDQGWLVQVETGAGTFEVHNGTHDSGRHSGGVSDAGAKTADSYVLIIDEINRANISKVFGELITLLEPDKRLGQRDEIQLTLPYSKRRFGVPANLHIVGTMNTADRSIALLDTALRRRFAFRELMPDPTVLSNNVDGINLKKLLHSINERIEYLFDREHQIGHAYFTGCRTRSDIEVVMRNKVIPLLAEYFYEDWSKVATVLGDTKQDRPRFLLREEIRIPEGMEGDSITGPRQRWRVKPERDSNGRGGFDFTEFEV